MHVRKKTTQIVKQNVKTDVIVVKTEYLCFKTETLFLYKPITSNS